MALKPCRECGKEVSTEAKTCPNCGVSAPVSVSAPSSSSLPGLFVLGIIGVIAVAIWASSDNSGASPATPPRDASRGTTKSGHIACSTEASFDRAIELSADAAAFAQFVQDSRNGCIAIKSGLKVRIDDVKFGKRKIHVEGNPTSLWVASEAISDP